MSETAEVQADQADQMSPQALVACMGVHACGRVCSVIDLEAPEPYEGEGALPFEHDCPSLSESETLVPEIYRRELTQAVSMPRLEFLGTEGTAAEADAYLAFLEDGHKKLETYTTTLLKGATMPRTAAVESAEEWRNHTYQSPNADILVGITEDEQAQTRVLYAQLRGFHDQDKLKNQHIMFDKAMQSIIEHSATELSVGHHVKLTGEPGVAKTSLAKYLGRLNARAHHPDWSDEQCEPILISMSSTTEAEAQVAEQTFEDNTLGSRLGLIAQAMSEGRVVILDEQNGMTADQQVYFNDMFLKAPGERVRVGNEFVTIARGFAVIATVNPMTDMQGNRRHGRQQQDSAGAARYTRIDVPYPGQAGYPGDAKETLSRLFYANYVEQYGWQQPTADVIKLLDNCQEYLIKLTEKATAPPTNGTATSGVLASAQARPELAECITPRDFSRILEGVMTHADLTGLAPAVRAAIATKTEQILNSDNGHYVSPQAVQAVKLLQQTNGFKTHA